VNQLKRELALVEEQLAWCMAVRASREIVERLLGYRREARALVASGDSPDRARELIGAIAGSTSAMLPRAREVTPRLYRPRRDDGDFIFESPLLTARVGANGALLDLHAAHARNAVAQANCIAAEREGRFLPRPWRRLRVVPGDAAVRDNGLEVPFRIGDSAATMRLTLQHGDPFLRVEFAVDWRETTTQLVVENWLALEAGTVTYDEPERERFAHASDATRGLAILADAGHGFSARSLEHGTHLRHPLRRARETGLAHVAWAYAPSAGASAGALEAAWEAFAYPPRVRLFTSADPAVLVTGCAPAEDGDGVLVSVRECEGSEREVRLRCGARIRSAEEAAVEAEELVAMIPAYGRRSFRVRFA
jgi:hypothetical protein